MKSIIFSLCNLLVETLQAVLTSLSHNWLVLLLTVVTAVVLKTYVNTEKLNQALLKRKRVSIIASVLVGAFTPFCACGTTAVIIGMLTTTLPWGPIMAFLTSSPLISPEGFIMISGLIGLRFAIALSVSSIIIGLASGFITNIIESRTTILHNQTRYADKENTCACTSSSIPSSCDCSSELSIKLSEAGPVFQEHEERYCCGDEPKRLAIIWAQMKRKLQLEVLLFEFFNLGIKQILLYFSIFVAIGYLINYFVPASIVSLLFGTKSILAVPLATLIGLPLYVTTESAIPVIQSMIQSGASEGAMLSFIIAGSATSAWVIAGLSTFLKKRAVGLYVLFILLGSIMTGYLYDIVLSLL